jgi:predicted CXXCH cytochrome family protein
MTPERSPGRRERLAGAARELWQDVRPRTRRGAILGTVVIAGSAAVLSVVFYVGIVGGLVMASPYLEYALHPERNAQAWAALEPIYGDVASCRECHAPQVDMLLSASHAGIGCESCHGPLLAHALSSPGPEAADLIAEPTDELCIRCHLAWSGRPDGFPQIRLADHYTVECLKCHDPHTGISIRPLLVLHPIANLPFCVTCHGDDAFRERGVRHPEGSEDDRACLECHGIFRRGRDD